MAESPKTMVHYTFKRPQHDDPNRLGITWALRSRPVDPPYTHEVIKSRPPFFGASVVSGNVMPDILAKYFPGLELRSGYKNGMFRGNPYKHLLLIYELEGYLQREEAPRAAHVLAGMNHFAQVVTDVVEIIQQPIKVSKTGVRDSHSITQITPHLNKKRLIVFLVYDIDRDHYCLAWYDQKHRFIFLVDSHNDGYDKMHMRSVRRLDVLIRKLLATSGCLIPLGENIIPLRTRPQMFTDTKGALHTINNLRMRLLESNEAVQPSNQSGYVDWPNSLFLLSGLISVKTTQEETTKDMMITAFKIEMGSNQTQLRWPEQPMVSDNHARYMQKDMSSPFGYKYETNAACAPHGFDFVQMSQEQPFEDMSGYRIRSSSVLALHIYAESRAPTEANIVSRVGTPVDSPRASKEPRKAPRQLITPLPNFSQLAIANFRRTDSDMTDPSDRRRKEPSRLRSLDPPSRVSDQVDPFVRAGSYHDIPKSAPLPFVRNRRDDEEDPALPSFDDNDDEEDVAQRAARRAARKLEKEQAAARKQQRIQQQQLELQQQLGHDKQYSFRTRMGPPATLPPAQPQLGYFWYERHNRGLQMDVDDGFDGWEYEMKKENWQKGRPQQ